jgi:hypothetical protein
MKWVVTRRTEIQLPEDLEVIKATMRAEGIPPDMYEDVVMWVLYQSDGGNYTEYVKEVVQIEPLG